MAINYIRILSYPRNYHCLPKLLYSSKSTSLEIPKNTLANEISSNTQKGHGAVYDKKPFKIPLEAGKRHSWCSCGRSKSQPFCDGTIKMPSLK
ncbi:hypothetical protein JTB14_009124 [Gonioctena quinquepunctata]|nr:hypothetical protein JTB14_009124 [Gonioctena quinquepunctata]